jgi:hypothetical protein
MVFKSIDAQNIWGRKYEYWKAIEIMAEAEGFASAQKYVTLRLAQMKEKERI